MQQLFRKAQPVRLKNTCSDSDTMAFHFFQYQASTELHTTRYTLSAIRYPPTPLREKTEVQSLQAKQRRLQVLSSPVMSAQNNLFHYPLTHLHPFHAHSARAQQPFKGSQRNLSEWKRFMLAHLFSLFSPFLYFSFSVQPKSYSTGKGG